jgi:hypothetical protein
MTGRRTPFRTVLRWTGRCLAVLALVGVVLGLVFHTWVTAQTRTVVLLSEVLNAPVLKPVVDALTDAPVHQEVELAGSPTSVYHPPGRGPWPGLLFLTGADESGRKNHTVERVARGLARAGYIVYVPDIAGLKAQSVDEGSFAQAVNVVSASAAGAGTAHHRLALASACAGTSLAMVIAAQPQLRWRVSVVGGLAPYADLRTVIMLGTTGHYRDRSGALRSYPVDPNLRAVMVRSLYAGLRQTKGLDPTSIDDLEQRSFPADGATPDPVHALDSLPTEGIDPRAAAAVNLLRNTDPARFDALYAGLDPQLRAWVERLSPVSVEGSLTMPVDLATSPHDPYFPDEQSELLAAGLAHAHLVVTTGLDHATPKPSQIGQLLALDGFVVRFMEDASRGT